MYAGGSTYQKDGKSGFANEYLKVIGEEYDDGVYTGELKKENGVAIKGECTSASKAYALFIPKNTVNKRYDAAAKFVVWAAGPEAQKILAKSSVVTPNQSNLGMSGYETKLDKNFYAAAYVAQNSDIGDYTYFTSETWITEWSFTFNKQVRGGSMTLDDFFKFVPEGQSSNILNVANTALKSQRVRILGR